MRVFTLVAFLVAIVSVCAIPITPSAPGLQRRAEQFRLKGLKEHEIAAKVLLPDASLSDQPQPFLSSLSTNLNSFFHPCSSKAEERDPSGDIAPGSLEAPQILPRPSSSDDTFLEWIIAAMHKEYAEKRRLGYEGKELELRRPTGMRHWGVQDKWRLF